MRRFISIAAIVILAAGWAGVYGVRAWRAAHVLTAEEIAEIPGRLESVPLRIEEPAFSGKRDPVDEETRKLSGADHCLAINYRDEGGGTVRLYIGAAARTDAWFHIPTVCMPAHGWTMSDAVRWPVWDDLPGVDADAQIWRMKLHRTGEEMLVYYWFHYGSRVVGSRTERRNIRFQDLLAGKRDRPVQIVILYAPIDRDEERSEERIEALVRALWPNIAGVVSFGE